MKHHQKKYVDFTRKMIILYCAAYLGFYANAFIGEDQQPEVPIEQQPISIPTIAQDPPEVLGESDQDHPPINDLIIDHSTKEASKPSVLAAHLEPVTPDDFGFKSPETSPIPEDLQLEAWWSMMEYKNRLDVSITAMEPIECEFQVTTYNGYKSTVRKSIPIDTETCTFEITVKDRNYTIWGKAISEDGKIREFGIR